LTHNFQGCTVFLDSGVGGLSYLGAYKKLNRGVNLLYIADKKNFPYGEKTKTGLVNILMELTARIEKHFSPAIIALACNTASVSALAELRQTFTGIDFVGTVPAVKPAMLASKKKRIAVLGTERTLQDEYITRIAEDTGGDYTVTRIAAGELVDFVERRLDYSGVVEKISLVNKYINMACEKDVDALVLGCTHFLFLLDEFKEAARPAGIKIFDSIAGVCGRIENLESKKNIPKAARWPRDLLFVTGGEKNDNQWLVRAARFDLELFTPRHWDDE
jgi:glutamate racemase